MVIFSETLE